MSDIGTLAEDTSWDLTFAWPEAGIWPESSRWFW